MITFKFLSDKSPAAALPVTIVVLPAKRTLAADDYIIEVCIDDITYPLHCVNPLNGFEMAVTFINSYMEAKGLDPFEVSWFDQ